MDAYMVWIEAKLRRWGRSLGVVVPMGAVKAENLKEGDTVKLGVLRKAHPFKELFGAVKFKGDTQKILDELDKELYDDDR
ncbi:MAG: AbrB/MazE/SpoVT family DNA-binding domain-containing protein [Candidatus Micrarchaeota archaeon]